MMQFNKYIFLSSFFYFIVLSPIFGKLIISDRGAGSIKIANFDGSSSEVLIPSAGTNVRGIATDLSMGLIFYADNGSDRIYKTNIDGSERTVIIGSGLGFPADITIDRFSKKIYWCDRNNDRIECSDYDGNNRRTIINTNDPYYLDLDLVNKKIYWGDFSGGNIFRAPLNDTRSVENIVTGLIRTRGVKVDPNGGYYYWCDRESHKVQRKPINGGEIEDLYTGLDTPHGMTLDIRAGKIYWVDTGTNSIGGLGAKAVSRGDMDGSGAQEVLANMSQPWDLTLDTRISDYQQWTQRRFYKTSDKSINGYNADPDKDSLTNLLEYFSGTDPLKNNPLPPLKITYKEQGLQLTYSINSQPIIDLEYKIEYSYDLKEWLNLEPSPDRSDFYHDYGPVTMTHDVETEEITKRNYFRVKIEAKQ